MVEGSRNDVPERRRPLLSRGSDAAGVPAGRIASKRPRHSLSWPLRGLLAASLIVPLLLLAGAAWQNYRLLQSEAEARVMQNVGVLHEHTLKVFETIALAIHRVDDRAHGLDFERIDHDEELHRFLVELEGSLPQIDSIWIIDAQGRTRASSRFFPVPEVNVTDRDYFVVQRERDAGIFVGQAYTGRLTMAPQFSISKRLTTADHSFAGIVSISVKPGYFTDFYSTLSHEKGFVVSLRRDDGSVMVRYPAPPASLAMASSGRLMQAVARQPDGGMVRFRADTDNIDRIYGYRRVQGQPVYVVFGIPTRGVLTSWGANLINYSLVAIPSSFGLFLMTLFALRQLQRQKIARWRWQTTAQRLRREMQRRTRAEEALRQSQKMEALGQLTGGVAHDFNNLLTILGGSLEMLSGNQRDAVMQARVDAALQTVDRGEKLTNQLLAFARRQPLAAQPVDLNARILSMTEMLDRTVGKQIVIDTDLAPGLWTAECDPNQLELAILNLVVNARDAMPEGGILRFRSFNTAGLTGEITGDFVGMAVTDSGKGMEAATLARVFEPFFTTKEAGKGTGLGLSMVYGFARQSGGTAVLRSELGQGTTATLYLPARAGNPGGRSGASRKSESAPGLQGAHPA